MQKMKINWHAVLFYCGISIAIFFLGRSCGIKSVIKTTHIDTTITKDSIVYRDKPMPYKITEKGKPYAVHDSTIEFDVIPTDTAAILKRFFDIAYYADSGKSNRSSFLIQDTVTQNRIAGRSVKITTYDTTIVKTVTLTQPKRIIFYTGGSLIFGANNYGVGADVSLKWQNDMIYGLAIKYLNRHETFYEAKVMLPIRLKK